MPDTFERKSRIFSTLLKINCVMKKIFLVSLLILLGIFTAEAKESEPINVYGVDYTSVKVFGASETVHQFADAFEGINGLLMQEAQKYDFTHVVGGFYKLKLDMIFEMTQDYTYPDLKVFSKDIEPVNVVDKIKNYKLKEESGTGLILIATLLDKSTNKGTYKVVLFDIATREILREGVFSGKAKGFGLRNYWARTVFRLLEKFSFSSENKR